MLGHAVETSRRRAIAATVLALVVAAGVAQQWRQSDRLAGLDADVEAAAAAVRASTRPGETIVSDVPLVAYLAGRPLPGELVDTSAVRFASGSLETRVSCQRRTQPVPASWSSAACSETVPACSPPSASASRNDAASVRSVFTNVPEPLLEHRKPLG